MPALLGGTPVVQSGLPDWPISDAAIGKVFEELLTSGEWGRYHGQYTERLIQELKVRYQVAHVYLTASGTAAVELALRGLKVGAGDEVLQSAYDFKSNFTNVVLLGGTPVLMDILAKDAQLDVSAIEEGIGAQTKGILASHLHGGLVEMRALRRVADQHDLSIIEDCCQISCEAVIAGTQVGKLGDVAVLSFGGSKLLSAGRGGAVLTQRGDIAQRVRLYQERGNTAYPMSEMQAAVLLPQFEQLAERAQTRRRAVASIQLALSNDAGLRPFTPRHHDVVDYYKLGLWYEPEQFAGLSRERFCAALRAEGIPLDPGFPSLHLIHSRLRFRQVGELPQAKRAHESLVQLHHPYLLEGETAGPQLAEALDKLQRYATILKN